MNNWLGTTDQQSYDRTIYSIRSTWTGLIADLSFRCGDLFVETDTTASFPALSPQSNWYQIDGKTQKGAFSFFVPADFFNLLMAGIDESIVVDNLDSGAASLMLEHALTPTLSTLENIFSTDIVLENISDAKRHEASEVLGLQFTANGKTYPGGLVVQGKLYETLEYLVQENSFEDEKSLDPKLVVHLGPVVLPMRNACLAGPDSAIDCGVLPTELIKGVLMRSDNRYWPIHIEDNEVEITGELSGPVDFSSMGDEHVFVTFALGSMSVPPVKRRNIQVGDRIEMDRYPDNGAHVHYQAVPYSKGTIFLMGDNLAVRVTEMEPQPISSASPVSNH